MIFKHCSLSLSPTCKPHQITVMANSNVDPVTLEQLLTRSTVPAEIKQMIFNKLVTQLLLEHGDWRNLDAFKDAAKASLDRDWYDTLVGYVQGALLTEHLMNEFVLRILNTRRIWYSFNDYLYHAWKTSKTKLMSCC